MVFVTPLVNDNTFDTMLEEAFCTPVTMVAANSDPGKRGSETLGPDDLVEGAVFGRRAVETVEGR